MMTKPFSLEEISDAVASLLSAPDHQADGADATSAAVDTESPT